MGVFFARNITTLKSTPTFEEILEFIANGRIFEIMVYSWYRWFPWGWEGGNNGADLLCCSFIPNLGKVLHGNAQLVTNLRQGELYSNLWLPSKIG